MDSFTKLTFYHALNNIRYVNQKSYFNNYIDYYDEFKEFLHDKKLFDQTLSFGKQKKKWDKSYYVLYATFYLLCYKRLNKIFKDDFNDENINPIYKDIIEEIDKLKESKILALIIYSIIDNKYKKIEDLKNI